MTRKHIVLMSYRKWKVKDSCWSKISVANSNKNLMSFNRFVWSFTEFLYTVPNQIIDIQSEIFVYQKRLATLTESCSAENFLLSFIVLRNCLSTMCHMQYYLEWRVRTDRRSTSFKKRTRTILSFFSCSFRSVSCVKAEKTFQYGLFNHLHFCNTKQFHRLWVYILVSFLLENMRVSKINRKTYIDFT